MRLLFVPLFLILEIAMSISLANVVGSWATIAWLLGALLLGLSLLRVQGPATIIRAAQEMRTGGQPGQAILDGVFKAVAAILLIIPGVVSDLVALLCLMPWVRRYFMLRLLSRVATTVQFRAQGFGPRPQGNIYEHQNPPKSQHPSGTGEYLEQDSRKNDN
jgi:UPF0716 protein FxsA